jgi:hypothetical protein
VVKVSSILACSDYALTGGLTTHIAKLDEVTELLAKLKTDLDAPKLSSKRTTA